MGRPTPKGDDRSKSSTNSPSVSGGSAISKSKRMRNFMGASRESLGFASLNERRIAQRYNRKKRKSMQICDSVSVNNIPALDLVKSNTLPLPKKSKNIENAPETPKPIDIDYEKIEKERKIKLEELQTSASNLSEKEVQKRLRKRKKMTKQLTQKTKRGQPLMGNHMQHLLSKIQSVASGK